MRVKQSLLAVLILGGLNQTANAMTEKEIRSTIADKRVLLETRFGIDFPLFYNANGTVIGDSSGFGISSYITPKEAGKWWLKEQKLCQRFPTWHNGETRCFKLEKLGNNTFKWYQDNGNSGRAKVN